QRPGSERWRLAARGQIEGIGTAPHLKAKDDAGTVLVDEKFNASTVRDGRNAVDMLANWLRSRWGGSRGLAVGHRVVHGGSRFTKPAIITSDVLQELYGLIPLAPLHQPYNLAAIEAVSDRLPDVPQVACFDTSFHCGHEPVADLVPMPRELTKGGLQR